MIKLGVNIDHIATLRQARKGEFPDPAYAASVCEKAGCDSIVAHLREDRRHINDGDIFLLKETLTTRFNLEMSAAADIVSIACKVKPHQATIVPEKRKELTTEGGLDVKKNKTRLKNTVKRLTQAGIETSLFIDPDKNQIKTAAGLGIKVIEIHTGRYADADSRFEMLDRLNEIVSACETARKEGLIVNAGHGLDYANVKEIARIQEINELNIGYSIICRSVFVGIDAAVKEMLNLIR